MDWTLGFSTTMMVNYHCSSDGQERSSSLRLLIVSVLHAFGGGCHGVLHALGGIDNGILGVAGSISSLLGEVLRSILDFLVAGHS